MTSDSKSNLDPATELRLRERDLDLKAREQDRLDREAQLKERGRKFDIIQGLLVGLGSVALTLITTGVTGNFTLESTRETGRLALENERLKAEGQRIVELIKTDFRREKADEVIRFLADAGLIEKNEKNKPIFAYTARWQSPANPSAASALQPLPIAPVTGSGAMTQAGPTSSGSGKINDGKPFEVVNSYFKASELSEHCKRLDETCQVYVGAAADTQDIWRAFHFPYWPIEIGRPQNIGDLIGRLNAYNLSHPENISATRSAAMMVIDGLAGSAKEASGQIGMGLSGKPQQ